MNRKTASTLLMIGGGIMAIYFGVFTVQGILRGIEYGDLSYNFLERLSPAPLLAVGIVELLIGIGGFNSKNGSKRTIPMVVSAIVTLLIGGFVFYLNALNMLILLVFAIGLITQVLYLVATKKS
jgi:hypothetical protein